MHLQLDGVGPVHAQLTRALKVAILGGLGSGAQLPSTRLLARELGVSRNTVLAAYEQLRAEGFIDSRVGSGSYVASEMPLAPLSPKRVRAGIEPQSAFARRMRECHELGCIPGGVAEGVVQAFQCGEPMTNPALTTLLARELSHAAQYTDPGYAQVQGMHALRAATCDYLARRRGVHASPEDVLIVSGTQQAIALIADVLVDPGDTVAIEEPHYTAIRKVLQSHGAHMHATPVDGEGIDCEQLPSSGAKLVCVTPSHQFPTGALMSIRRRMALLDYASRHDAWVFEDDYDGEFRYDSKPLDALRSLDDHDRVIYVGTFSKSVFPTLRLGYLIMPPQLRRDFISAKWMSDFASPGFEQAAMAQLIVNGGFERHLRRSAQELKKRRQALIDGLQGCSQGRLVIQDSRAGMHLVVWLPEFSDDDVVKLIRTAQSARLGLYSIAPMYIGSSRRAGLVMGYSGLSVAEINQALAIFAHCLDEVAPASMQRALSSVGRSTARNARSIRKHRQRPGEVRTNSSQ